MSHTYYLGMAKTLETTLEITGWDEQSYEDIEGGAKCTRAEVTLKPGPDGLGPATSQSLMYYRPDGTSSLVSLMRVSGTIDGRSGSFVLLGQGSYDATTALVESVVVEGSGTGELAGISGTAVSRSTKDDYPNMPLTLVYDIE